MIKDWLPFIIFASIIAICTLFFIIRGNMQEDEPEVTDAEEGDGSLEPQDRE
jgi:hypothetical protein